MKNLLNRTKNKLNTTFQVTFELQKNFPLRNLKIGLHYKILKYPKNTGFICAKYSLFFWEGEEGKYFAVKIYPIFQILIFLHHYSYISHPD